MSLDCVIGVVSVFFVDIVVINNCQRVYSIFFVFIFKDCWIVEDGKEEKNVTLVDYQSIQLRHVGILMVDIKVVP